MKLSTKLLPWKLWLISIVFLPSCQVPGCMDDNALNFSIDATADDGTCRFSRCVFYNSVEAYEGLNPGDPDAFVLSSEVFINGDIIGETTGTYFSQPGNCSAANTVLYELKDGESLDWNVKIYLDDGTTIDWGGVVRADPDKECIKISVTP